MVNKGKLVSEESSNAIAICSVDVQIQTDLKPLKKMGVFKFSMLMEEQQLLHSVQ